MKKVLILGSAGILGAHLRLTIPPGVEPIWHRRTADALHIGCDLNDMTALDALLVELAPDVIVNLAGENRPDVVERNPGQYFQINQLLPAFLAGWCSIRRAHYVHISSQAVFGGRPKLYSAPVHVWQSFDPPYASDSHRMPVNQYGIQKMLAEQEVRAAGGTYWTILRPTFVVGIRPMPGIGRQNPIEQMLAPAQVIAEGITDATQRQVCDRWFSVSFARWVAKQIWETVVCGPQRRAVNLSIPYRTNRHNIASYLRPDANIEPVSHDEFPGLAPRPVDTTYAGEGNWAQLSGGLDRLKEEYCEREHMTIEQRAREIAIFLQIRESDAIDKLRRGFGPLHQAVTADWNLMNPRTDQEILEWYRTTESYIWELSAYHADPGFNYMGQIGGIAEALKAKGVQSVMCLGDGIGDLSLLLTRQGFTVAYHDLGRSRTAEFAKARFLMYGVNPVLCLPGGECDTLVSVPCCLDSIVSMDFLEHVVDVLSWVRAIHSALKPGGWFMAQNAFACGSGPDGSIPMHLDCNDRFEKDWDPLLLSVGFRQESSNWYQKAIGTNQ